MNTLTGETTYIRVDHRYVTGIDRSGLVMSPSPLVALKDPTPDQVREVTLLAPFDSVVSIERVDLDSQPGHAQNEIEVI